MNARQATMLLALAAIWGASFLFIAIAVDDFRAIGVAEARVALGAVGLIIYATAIGRMPALRARWRGYLVLGTVNAALPFALIAAAELTIPASLAAIVNATAPLSAALIGAIWLSEPLTRTSAGGLLVGIAGVALVVGLAPITLNGHTLLAIGASLMAAALYGVGGHMAKRRFAGVPPLTLSIGQLTGAALVLLPALAISPPRHTPGAGPIAAIVALGLVATGFAYLLYFRLIEGLGATGALTVTQLVPIFGVLWAALFRGEQITIGMIAGTAVVLAGVLLVTGTDPRRLRSPAPPPAEPHEATRDRRPEPPAAAPQRAAR